MGDSFENIIKEDNKMSFLLLCVSPRVNMYQTKLLLWPELDREARSRKTGSVGRH